MIAIKDRPAIISHPDRPMVPTVALRNLWTVWGTGPILDDATYWAAFRDRYGLVEAPWPNDDLPLGLHPNPTPQGELFAPPVHIQLEANRATGSEPGAQAQRLRRLLALEDAMSLGEVLYE